MVEVVVSIKSPIMVSRLWWGGVPMFGLFLCIYPSQAKKNQCLAIPREFEPFDPTLLKNPLSARWDLLRTL